MAQETTTFELREPDPPDHLLPDGSEMILWLTLASGFVVSMIAVAWLVWRKFHPRKPDPLLARRLAYQDAVSALDGTAASNPRAAAVQVSLILRRYLAAALGDPVLYETHEEFISRHDSLKSLTEPAREACQRGFAALAALKYAPAESAGNPAEVVAGARSLLETLNLGIQG